MIDVSQWRASIGLWNYCQAASRGSIVFKKYCRPASSGPASECCQYQLIKATTEDSESDSTGYIQKEKRCTLPAVLFIIGFIVIYFCFLLLKHNSIPPPGHCYCYQVQYTTGDIVTDTLQSVALPGDINIFSLISRLLLLLSGDVELNPGPTVEEICLKIKEILRSHYAVLEEATKGSLNRLLSHLYAKRIITESGRDSLNYSKMMKEFKANLSLSKDESELKAHCQVFLECISQGGPTDAVARSLDSEWGKVFDMESLLSMPAAVPTLSSNQDQTQHDDQNDYIRLHDDIITIATGTESDDQKSDTPPDVSKYCSKLEDIEEIILMKKFSKLTGEEKEFIKKVRYILVTATTIEYCAVMGAIEPTGADGKYIRVITKDKVANFILGKYTSINVAITRTGQGPNETEDILVSVQKDVEAKYVIAIGICYGANESKTKELSDKTNLGDIIVAKSIVDTAHQRIEGKDTIVLPTEYQCGKNLFKMFKHDEVFKIEAKKQRKRK
ncbi:PREDICTED: uncharacterized protein LOC105314337 isoform X2 [Amphimedon queenslandica]|uniref:Nucleoside phosphorylase domain-containing protein n=1 Tax=Amphimedon queenslandica TaxID=400682 RepID=A0AAN0JLJ0_AMPQE|nr:PREDICTED: uncharacterized protein LOC105314337 isoform X2 [Amphimedon queenslandica]|eukprot:XP_019857626.1 PREDICTED: uncharacterized protein LOC105314337 isoform X2 [Amphimedon queenslandica]